MAIAVATSALQAIGLHWECGLSYKIIAGGEIATQRKLIERDSDR